MNVNSSSRKVIVEFVRVTIFLGLIMAALWAPAPALFASTSYEAGVAKTDITPGYPIRLCG